MIKTLFLFLTAIISCATCYAQAPRVFILDGARLAEVKKKYLQKDPVVIKWIDDLEKRADDFLTMKPVSVMDKGFTPVSGNKHDYMSQAPYFWYDSSKPNGLPYLRRDGERNPEIYKITDRKFIGELETATRTLSLAWYFTGKEKYAEKSARLLQHWFLDSSTRMNPHLEYAQAIPGVNNGRGIGIIETIALTGIADAIGLLQGSANWTDAQMKSIQYWYAQYLEWLLSSKNGKDEQAAKNNHGTWYYVQVMDFALFTSNTINAKILLEECRKKLDEQITAEGKMPLELERTNALGYTSFNIQAWFTLANLAEKAGADLWSYKNKQGANLRMTLDWILPYAMGDKPWTYQQITSYNKNEIYLPLLMAARKFGDDRYAAALSAIRKQSKDFMPEMLYGTQ